jgi:pimeloyl-ACP methyl ester carboxylesterase
MTLALLVALTASFGPAALVRGATTTPTRHSDTVLHVEVTGKGRPMLFLPGLASPGEAYADAVARYAPRHECHVVTLGGFAGQPRFEGPFLATARDSLISYLRRRALDRPLVVGHSLGGVLAMQLALAAPDRVGPLVILDALPFLGGAGSATATEETVRQSFEPMRRMIREQTQESYAAFQRASPFLAMMATRPEDVTRIREWAAASNPATVADAMSDANATDLRARMPEIRSPMLVLGTWHGMKAFTTRARVDSVFRAQFRGAPDASIAIADSAHHFLMLDDPEWTWGQVDAFLARNAPVRGKAAR